MIDKIHGVYHLVCDNCGAEADLQFVGFVEAAEYKRDHGWIGYRDCDEWLDICPDCQKD